MAKKILDIFPPKELEKKIREIKLEPEKKPQPRIPFPKVPSKKSWGLIFVLIILISAGIFCYFAPPHLWGGAKIEIWPETEILTFKTKLTVNKEAKEPDFLTKVIPGEIFTKKLSIREEFPSSGKTLKEKKAEGIIRVYNAYSTSSQVLIANTRFVSADGKLFRSIERVTIPGQEYQEGKLIPGYLDIKVRADQSGSEYNIGSSTFSIPGFAGTPRYTAFYGKSFQPMIGGLREEVSQVTQEDLNQAQKRLEEKGMSDCEIALKNEIPAEFVLLEEALETKIIETFSLAKAGAELKTFSFQIKAKSQVLVFRADEIRNFARDFILAQIPEDKKLYLESLKLNYSPESVNLELGKIILSLQLEAKIYSDINQETLKGALRGKSLKEAQWLLENQPKITKIQMTLWPFWIKRVPEKLEKIKIKLNLD